MNVEKSPCKSIAASTVLLGPGRSLRAALAGPATASSPAMTAIVTRELLALMLVLNMSVAFLGMACSGYDPGSPPEVGGLSARNILEPTFARGRSCAAAEACSLRARGPFADGLRAANRDTEPATANGTRRAACRFARYSAIADAAASANGLPSESRHTAH
jgi:hypothetical protein